MPGLEDLYKEIIMDHYRSPRNQGELASPPAHHALGINPSCGDEITVYVSVDDDDIITDVAIDGRGCSISQSAASMMSEAIKGKTTAEAAELSDAYKGMLAITDSGDKPDLSMGDLVALRGVSKFPARIKCATLGFNTLLQALENSGSTTSTE